MIYNFFLINFNNIFVKFFDIPFNTLISDVKKKNKFLLTVFFFCFLLDSFILKKKKTQNKTIAEKTIEFRILVDKRK